MRIRMRKLSNGSVYKLLLIGMSIPLFPFMLVCGIASIFGAHTVMVNQKPVTGIMGLVAAMIMYLIFCILFPALMWVAFSIGLWIYSKFRKIELECVDAEILSPPPVAEKP